MPLNTERHLIDDDACTSAMQGRPMLRRINGYVVSCMDLFFKQYFRNLTCSCSLSPFLTQGTPVVLRGGGSYLLTAHAI